MAREPAVAGEVVDPLWAERLEDQVRSLKGLVALLAVLALAGIGLGLYALLGENDDRRGASPERVERLNGRVDRLESRLGATTNEAEVARLEDRLDTKADTQSLDELTSEVQQLQASVEEASAGATPLPRPWPSSTTGSTSSRIRSSYWPASPASSGLAPPGPGS